MRKIAEFIFKSSRRIIIWLVLIINKFTTWILFYCYNVRFQKFYTSGIPYVSIAGGGKCLIGNNFRMNNGNMGNPIGRPQRCVLFADKGALIVIGENVGMSSTAIVSYEKISIGDNVKIGGGVCIYDTNFHSLDPSQRKNKVDDFKNRKNKPVKIGNNVFIGAHSTILKGVEIGDNSIIGACSVVTKNIPANEIWGGNPAILLRKL